MESIDSLHVELSLDSSKFVSQLKKSESALDKLERESKKFEGAVEQATNKVEKLEDGVDAASKRLSKYGEVTKKVSDETELFKSEIDKLLKPLSDVKSTLDKVKGLVGVLGVGVGVTELIQAFKQMAQDAQAAVDAYTLMQTTFSTRTGRELTTAEREVQRAISIETGFGIESDDKQKIDLSGIMSKIVTFSPEIDIGTLQELTKQYAVLQKLFGTDAVDAVTEYTKVLKNYDVSLKDYTGSLAYLGSVSQQTQIPIGELVSTLADKSVSDYSKQLGLSINQTAHVIGNSFRETATTEKIKELFKLAGDIDGEEYGSSVVEKAQETIKKLSSDVILQGNITASYEGYVSTLRPSDIKSLESEDERKRRELITRAADIQQGKGKYLGVVDSLEVSAEYSGVLGKQTNDLENSLKNLSEWISDTSKAISGVLGISAASVGEVKGLDDKLSVTSKTLEDLPGTLTEVTEQNLMPLNEQLSTTSETMSNINEFAVAYDMNTHNLLIPAVQDEAESVKELKEAWEAALAAKLEYMNR